MKLKSKSELMKDVIEGTDMTMMIEVLIEVLIDIRNILSSIRETIICHPFEKGV